MKNATIDHIALGWVIPERNAAKFYRGEGTKAGTVYFVKNGEFREPRMGEYYLSGAIPFAYQARMDLSNPYHICRLATQAEISCDCCGQFLRPNFGAPMRKQRPL